MQAEYAAIAEAARHGDLLCKGTVIAMMFVVPDSPSFNARTKPALTLVPKTAPAGGMQTVAQFCAGRGVSLTVPCMSRIGRKATALSRAAGLLMGRAEHDGFAVNTYDAGVLVEAFAASQMIGACK